MFSIKHFLIFSVGYLVGYAVGGVISGAVLGGLALALQFTVVHRAKRVDAIAGERLPSASPPQESAEFRRMKERYSGFTLSPLIRRLVFVWFAIAVLPFFYNVMLTLAHVSGATDAWVQIFQPTVDWFGAYVPAIKRTPHDLNAIGYANWAPVVQHAMLVGWLLTAPMIVWMTLDVVFIHRNIWAGLAAAPRKEMVWMTVGSAIFTTGMFLVVFVGSKPSSWHDAFVGVGLPGLGLFFPGLALTYFIFVTSTVLLVRSISQRLASRREIEEERKSRSELTATLRRTFRKAP